MLEQLDCPTAIHCRAPGRCRAVHAAGCTPEPSRTVDCAGARCLFQQPQPLSHAVLTATACRHNRAGSTTTALAAPMLSKAADSPTLLLVTPAPRHHTSSSASNMLGMPLTTGNRLPVSGQIKAPSCKHTCTHGGQQSHGGRVISTTSLGRQALLMQTLECHKLVQAAATDP